MVHRRLQFGVEIFDEGLRFNLIVVFGVMHWIVVLTESDRLTIDRVAAPELQEPGYVGFDDWVTHNEVVLFQQVDRILGHWPAASREEVKERLFAAFREDFRKENEA